MVTGWCKYFGVHFCSMTLASLVYLRYLLGINGFCFVGCTTKKSTVFELIHCNNLPMRNTSISQLILVRSECTGQQLYGCERWKSNSRVAYISAKVLIGCIQIKFATRLCSLTTNARTCSINHTNYHYFGQIKKGSECFVYLWQCYHVALHDDGVNRWRCQWYISLSIFFWSIRANYVYFNIFLCFVFFLYLFYSFSVALLSLLPLSLSVCRVRCVVREHSCRFLL